MIGQGDSRRGKCLNSGQPLAESRIPNRRFIWNTRTLETLAVM
jgi:hypothetical protein